MYSVLKEQQGIKATIAVTVDQETVDATFERVIRTYARQVRVPGFRPGKAPRGVIVKRIGEEALAEEAREAIIEASYPAAIRQHDLQAVYAHAHGDNPTEGQAFEYELHVELYPDFTIPDPETVTIETAPEAISDERIEETITNLRREHATQVPVDRPIEAGDVVHIETVGDDGEATEGTSMPIDLDTVNALLGDQLLGKNIGDVFDLQLEEPHVHEGEEEERAISTRIRIADVKAKELPEVGDEFASTMGFDSWEDVLTAIRSTLEDQAKQRAGEAQREEFVEKLLEGTTVELPPYLVNRRKLNLLESLARDLRRQGMEMDAYLAKLDADGKREEFESELTESAEKGVKRDLVLEKLLELRPAEVSDDEFRSAVRYMAQREGKDEATFRKEYGEEWLVNYRFLLQRDKSLRDTVAALTGETSGVEEKTPEAPEATDEPAEGAAEND